MPAVRDCVTLHPETVEKAEQVARDLKSARRQAKSEDPAVTHRYLKRPSWVNPLVWKTAARLAHGNTRRLNIVSATVIIVENDRSTAR